MQNMIKLVCRAFIYSNNFFIKLFTYIKMSKDLSAKYYQNNNETLQAKMKKKKKATIWS